MEPLLNTLRFKLSKITCTIFEDTKEGYNQKVVETPDNSIQVWKKEKYFLVFCVYIDNTINSSEWTL